MQWSVLKRNFNEDFISEFPGESSLKTTNTAANIASIKEEIEKGKPVKKMKIIRNIKKEYVKKN